jgi:predicted enzyme related to lactoylglutathione lyase
VSVEFYEVVFGWKIERREDGRFSFTETSDVLIGRWVTGRSIACEPGLMCYIYVANIDETISRIPTLGGRIITPKREEGDIWVATLTDPAGNQFGVWQFMAG